MQNFCLTRAKLHLRNWPGMSLYADRIYTFVLLMFKLDAVTKNAQDSGFLKLKN